MFPCAKFLRTPFLRNTSRRLPRKWATKPDKWFNWATHPIGLRYRSIHRSCSLKTLCLEEETPAQVFSSEFYESFINSLFTEHLQKTEHSVVRFCLHFKEYMLRTSTLFQKSFACLRFALFHAPWRNTGSEKNYCNHRAPSWRFLSLSKFTWDPKWAQTGLRFHFGIKFHFGVR